MKFYYKYICLVALVLSSVSCKKYLDVTPDNLGTLEYAFRNRNEAENYLFSCYAYMQRMSDVATNPGFTISSEIIYPDNLTNYQGFNTTGFNLIKGRQSSASPGLNIWDGENGSYSLFRSIRLCNILLENIDQPIDLSSSEKQRWIAEAKFLKAYYHYCLFRMYGPIPLIKVNLPIVSSTEEVRVKRASTDEVVDYIVSLLDEASVDLPSVISNQAKELGRITKPIALSVKAEVLATAASPLFNGNPDYASFKDKDGVNLFSTSYDAQKWKKASDACLAAITACEAQGIQLYTFTPPVIIGKLSDSLKKVLTIQNAVTEKWDENPELVWAQSPTFDYQGSATPRLTQKATINVFSNPSTFSVPIQTQELFYTDKGVPINEDNTWDYTNRYTLKTGDEPSRFYIKEGYETVKAHFNREPRFYADIAFDGGIWFGNGRYDQNTAYHVQSRGSESFAGPKDMIRLNSTGYWPKKLVNYLSVYDENFSPVPFHLPIIRLAGLYLLYAEAENELSGPTSPAVYTYVNKVRTRAGLPTVQTSWTNYSKNPGKITTKDGMRQIIHQERRIELCFEAQSGWDLRRWKELQSVLSSPLQGWNVYEADALNFYRPRTLVNPVFGIRDYLWPIKDNNLVVNPNLVQNPYW
ncbi:MAG: RagB/SusD family nutrient uptake outer membrane protein [Sphingobacteriales bacterium]|nr:RagB/SusD family nutrient uptake outer membrane protein [Sphingobacteriales bacterium]